MSKVEICRNHDLDHEQCKAVAEMLLDKLVDKYGGKIKQDGENFNYRHTSGMSAVVEPKVGELGITVKLNMLTRSFAPMIEEQINLVLDEHID